MKNHLLHPLIHPPFSVGAGFVAVAIALSGASAWFTWNLWSPPISASHQTESSAALAGVPQRLQAVVLSQPQIYLLQGEAGKLALEPKAVDLPPNASPEVALTVALNQLLTVPHPANADLTTTIPEGTRLLDLQINSSGIYINLSHEFAAGGGSDSMIYRVGQVVFTATSLDPQAKVFLAVEGQAIDEDHPLAGEGLLLQQPTTRQTFVGNFLEGWL